MAFLRNIFQDTLEIFVFDLGFCHGFSQLVPANTLTRLKVFVVRNCPHYIKKLAHIQRFTHNIMTLIHHIKKLAHIKRFTHNIMALTHHIQKRIHHIIRNIHNIIRFCHHTKNKLH